MRDGMASTRRHRSRCFRSNTRCLREKRHTIDAGRHRRKLYSNNDETWVQRIACFRDFSQGGPTDKCKIPLTTVENWTRLINHPLCIRDFSDNIGKVVRMCCQHRRGNTSNKFIKTVSNHYLFYTCFRRPKKKFNQFPNVV